MQEDTTRGDAGHVYRADKFVVPKSAREEFLSRAKASALWYSRTLLCNLRLASAWWHHERPTQARLKSLMTHAVFGLGLYASAIGMNYVLQVYG